MDDDDDDDDGRGARPDAWWAAVVPPSAAAVPAVPVAPKRAPKDQPKDCKCDGCSACTICEGCADCSFGGLMKKRTYHCTAQRVANFKHARALCSSCLEAAAGIKRARDGAWKAPAKDSPTATPVAAAADNAFAAAAFAAAADPGKNVAAAVYHSTPALCTLASAAAATAPIGLAPPATCAATAPTTTPVAAAAHTAAASLLNPGGGGGGREGGSPDAAPQPTVLAQPDNAVVAAAAPSQIYELGGSPYAAPQPAVLDQLVVAAAQPVAAPAGPSAGKRALGGGGDASSSQRKSSRYSAPAAQAESRSGLLSQATMAEQLDKMAAMIRKGGVSPNTFAEASKLAHDSFLMDEFRSHKTMIESLIRLIWQLKPDDNTIGLHRGIDRINGGATEAYLSASWDQAVAFHQEKGTHTQMPHVQCACACACAVVHVCHMHLTPHLAPNLRLLQVSRRAHLSPRVQEGCRSHPAVAPPLGFRQIDPETRGRWQSQRPRVVAWVCFCSHPCA